jgi:hypothetical protein
VCILTSKYLVQYECVTKTLKYKILLISTLKKITVNINKSNKK